MEKRPKTKTVRGVQKIATGRYRIRGEYVDPKTGKRREIETVIEAENASEADVERRKRLRAAAEGEQSPERIRVKTYAYTWLAFIKGRVKTTTLDHYALLIQRHILPTLGDHFIDRVTRDDIVAWRDAQACKPRPLAQRLAVLRGLFADAARELQIRDPAVGVQSEKVRGFDDDRISLTPEQLVHALESMKGWLHYDLAVTMALTGLRSGEVRALKWGDVDFPAGVITVKRRFYPTKSDPNGIDVPKSGKVRVVGVDRELAQILADRKKRLERDDHPGLVDGWVFAGPRGRPLHPNSLAAMFRHATDELKLPRLLTPHALRRAYVDLSRLGKVRPEVNRAQVGHADESMTMGYSRVSSEEHQSAAEMAGDVLRRARVTVAERDADE